MLESAALLTKVDSVWMGSRTREGNCGIEGDNQTQKDYLEFWAGSMTSKLSLAFLPFPLLFSYMGLMVVPVIDIPNRFMGKARSRQRQESRRASKKGGNIFFLSK